MEQDIEDCSILSEIVPRTAENLNPTTPSATTINENPNGVLLEPDHPLLAKFQQVLKEQLERQIQKLSEEVQELEAGIKKKEAERHELGSIIQSVQEITANQLEIIKKNEIEIQKYAAERTELENEVAEIKTTHKEKREMLFEVQKKEKELSNEISAINYLMKQMLDWEKKLNADLAVNKRISGRTNIDKKDMSKEKRFLDFIIYKLMTEVYRLENSVEHLSMIIDEKEKEREQLADYVAINKTNLEMMEAEHKKLMQSWNSVITEIGQRDKIYTEAKAELDKKQEELRSTIAEIEAARKLCDAEMDREEELSKEKMKREMTLSQLNAKLQSQKNKLNKLEIELEEIQPLLIQTEKDLSESAQELKQFEDAMEEAEQQLLQQKNLKAELETKMLNKLEGYVSCNSDVRYLNKEICERRENNRKLEIEVANLENVIAQLNVDIEQTKMLNVETKANLTELARDTKIKEEELKNMTTELELLIREVKKKEIDCEALSKRYNELQEKFGNAGLSAEENEAIELKKKIAELEEENKKLENQWLRQQANIIKTTERRQKQINDINFLRTSNMFLLQAKLTLEDNIEELQRQEFETNRNMTNLKIKLNKLGTGIVESKDLQEYLNKYNDLTRNDFGQQLKEIEMECIQLEALVADMDQSKLKLTRELTDLKRELLAWEGNIHRIEEQKKSINQEKRQEGELSAMKIEIHRMTIRYGQLKKAQEKLIHDLNNCIQKRDYIWSSAEATEKRLAVGGKVSSRANLKRKLDDMKTKLKKTEHEVKVMEKKLTDACGLENELEDKAKQQQMQMKDIDEKCTELDNNIEVATFDRQKELDILLFKQHKLNAYMNICKGLYKRNFRSMTSLESEFEKQTDINAKLQAVIENLLVDFPNHYLVFNKILNVLKLTSTQ